MAVALPAGLSPVQIEEFGGLRLDVDPEELGFRGAVDLLNVELAPGRVRARYGTSLFLTTTNNIIALEPYLSPSAGRYLVVATTGTTGNVAAYRYDGTIVGTAGDLNVVGGLVSPVSAQHIGTPAASYVYVSSGQATMARFDGTTWTNPTMPAANVLGLSPTDNRLVAAGISGNLHRVQFSDPGVPETFQTNNYVDLSPGDGEQILAAATWGNSVFIFKKTKFFVFYGNSSHFAADGTEVDDFNYRTYDTGLGALSWHCAAAGPDGVYFLDRTGVYRTAGGPAVKVSEALDPFFTVGSPLFLGGATHDPTRGAHVSFAAGRLYVQVEHTGAGRIVFVFDPKLDAWSVWTPPGTVPLTGRVPVTEIQATSSNNSGTSVVLGAGTGVYRVNPALANDNGAAISARYRSGFSDFGRPAVEKTIRETELVGKDTPSLAWAREFGSYSSPQAISIGSDRRALDRTAHVGELLSYELSGTNQWEIERLVPMLRGERGVGEKTSGS